MPGKYIGYQYQQYQIHVHIMETMFSPIEQSILSVKAVLL